MENRKLSLPNYNHCIANLPNSILKQWNLEQRGESLEVLDRYLKKDYQNVVVILLDGMGTCIMDENLDKQGFFHTHFVESYSSVFPPTTVAATTSVANGLTPAEHGWLGWDCYFPQINKNVSVFLNMEPETKEPAAEYNVAWKYCPYESIVSYINQAGGCAYEATPFAEPYPQNFDEICERIVSLCQLPHKKYIYSYWNEPDGIMHKKGCYGEEAKSVLISLEERVKTLAEQLEDTLIVITADHGHMDSEGVAITDYPEIMDCLERLPSIEPRALNLFTKEGKKEKFEQEFKKEFGDEFILWSKKKVLEEKIFGIGKEYKNFKSMLGDYLAIAVGDLSIYNTKEETEHFIGVHAGLTEDEMKIPLIVIEKK